MITKAQVKHIRSLEDKKNRIQFGEFVIEGDKMVRELLNSNYKIKALYATEKWIQINRILLKPDVEVVELNESLLKSISQMSTPNQAMAVAFLPIFKQEDPSGVSLLLDDIQDPGNLGSIIRIADWFGVKNIYCSENTVDAFNYKVVQASMGSIFRIRIQRYDLKEFLSSHKNVPSFAAVLDGNPIDQMGKITEGFIVIGNESKGIHSNIIECCSHKLTIPKRGLAESLNASVATGIICHALLS